MLHIHGQDVFVSNAFLDLENTELVMDLHAEDGGRIAVGIPKDMLDSRNGVESDFEVRIDQKRVTAQEMLGMANSRLI